MSAAVVEVAVCVVTPSVAAKSSIMLVKSVELRAPTLVIAVSRPATAATAAVGAVRYTPASPLPENVISADATPAVSTRAVVVRR